jgi:hypothetical protein
MSRVDALVRFESSASGLRLLLLLLLPQFVHFLPFLTASAQALQSFRFRSGGGAAP